MRIFEVAWWRMLQFAFAAPGGKTRNNAWKSKRDKFDPV